MFPPYTGGFCGKEKKYTYGEPNVSLTQLIYTWQKWKKVYSLDVPAMKILGKKRIGLKSSNCTLKITIFVNMWNLGQFRLILMFCK